MPGTIVSVKDTERIYSQELSVGHLEAYKLVKICFSKLISVRLMLM